MQEYSQHWAAKQFGEKYVKEIAYILDKYTRYNSRRKPELLAPETYSLTNYKEAETVVADYNKLVAMAERINNSLSAEYKDAFFQLVLHPVTACANMNELYLAAAKNRVYAKQGRAMTNILADKVEYFFQKDSLISETYNKKIANGKWNHMMDQTHIGYTYWQQPDKNVIPKTERIVLPEAAEMGVAIEGSANWWPSEKSEAQLPEFDKYQQQSYYVDVFNRGKTPVDFSVRSDQPWIKISEQKGKVENEKRIWISIDWKNAPNGKNTSPITISGTNNNVTVQAIVDNQELPKRENVDGFVESNGYVSIDAENFSKEISNEKYSWKVIKNLGRTGSAVTSFPVTSSTESLDAYSPHLEYKLYLFTKGEVSVKTYLSTTLNFLGSPSGLRYAISIDDEKPQIINMTPNPNPADLNRDGMWNRWMADNINIQSSKHVINSPGNHILKIWRLDPGVVFQKFVIDTGGLKPSYLGPQQSYNSTIKIVAGE